MAVETTGGDHPAKASKKSTGATRRGKTSKTRKRRKTPKRSRATASEATSATPEPAPKAAQVDVAAVAEALPATGQEEAAGGKREPARRSAGRAKRTIKKKSRKKRAAPRTTRREPKREQARAPEEDSATKAPPEDDRRYDEASAAAPGKMPEAAGTRNMLINVSAGDECRIAVLHEGRLEELFIERESTQSHVGNIYKGRITNVEPSIQAVFVDFGLAKNGFLHISDVQPQYFRDHTGETEEVGRKIPRHSRPPIQKCFRRGQEVIVQVSKEGVGTKGPTLTTYMSIPGRFLVMMPGMHHHGVSRKIEDEADRRKMRKQLDELDLPRGMGFILRTAGQGETKRELKRDLNYLLRLWKTVVERVGRLPAPAELYRESDLVTRTMRDIYTADFSRVLVDDPETAKKAREFLRIAMPRSKTVVELYAHREPLFHRFGIEHEIEQIGMRDVPLPSGGSLVIETTEAMVTIDVNSGRFRALDDAEETAFRLNLEAAEEVARQLRLRDLGGLVVVDFIDMRLDRHKRAVERGLRDALRKHKERFKILRMSAFGLIEMTRQRQGPAMKRNIYFDCPQCKGTGQVKMPESVMLDVMRIVQLAAHNDRIQRITVTVASEVAFQILNSKRAVLNQIEAETQKTIIVHGHPSFTSDQVEHACEDSRGQPVLLLTTPRGGSGTGFRARHGPAERAVPQHPSE